MFSVNVSVAFETDFGSLKPLVLSSQGISLQMKYDNFNILWKYFKLSFYWSEILGCQMKFNQKPNSTNDYDLKYKHIEMLQCSKYCLNDDSCSKGWLFNNAKEVF